MNTIVITQNMRAAEEFVEKVLDELGEEITLRCQSPTYKWGTRWSTYYAVRPSDIPFMLCGTTINKIYFLEDVTVGEILEILPHTYPIQMSSVDRASNSMHIGKDGSFELVPSI